MSKGYPWFWKNKKTPPPSQNRVRQTAYPSNLSTFRILWKTNGPVKVFYRHHYVNKWCIWHVCIKMSASMHYGLSLNYQNDAVVLKLGSYNPEFLQDFFQGTCEVNIIFIIRFRHHLPFSQLFSHARTVEVSRG